MINNNNVIFGVGECESVTIRNTTNGKYDTFPYVGDYGYPLTRGPGMYSVIARYKDGSFNTLYTEVAEVTEDNMTAYTMQSNAFVDVDAAKELLEYVNFAEHINPTVNDIYKYVYHKVGYDYIKAVKVAKTKLYRPDITEIFNKKKGICWDKTCLFAALCRAARIPCQICVGTLKTGMFKQYHSWCRVLTEEGKWKSIDPTNGTKYKAENYSPERFF